MSGYCRFIFTVLIPSSSWASSWTSALKSFLDCDSLELDSALAHRHDKTLANEDTLLRTHCCRYKCFPVCPRSQHLLWTQILCPGHKKCFWFCSETFCVRNKCFPVCAAQETSWAIMCPQQCVLLYQDLYAQSITFIIGIDLPLTFCTNNALTIRAFFSSVKPLIRHVSLLETRSNV